MTLLYIISWKCVPYISDYSIKQLENNSISINQLGNKIVTKPVPRLYMTHYHWIDSKLGNKNPSIEFIPFTDKKKGTTERERECCRKIYTNCLFSILFNLKMNVIYTIRRTICIKQDFILVLFFSSSVRDFIERKIRLIWIVKILACVHERVYG